MMSLNAFSKFLYVLVFLPFLVLLFHAITYSQGIATVEDDDYKPRTRTLQEYHGCNCIRIRHCHVLRYKKNWRTLGETCEFGYGDYRKVCCPKRKGKIFSITAAPLTDVSSSLSPRRSAPIPTLSIKQECGQSRSLSLFPVFISPENYATERIWPWMVAIGNRERSGNSSIWCSGFLVDETHVISAAHCYEKRNPDRYTARIDSINQNEAEEYGITRIEVPAGYTAGMFYDDIAILTLDRKVDFPNFNPICLPDEEVSRLDLTGRGTTEVGWAEEKPGGGHQKYLRLVSHIPIISNGECNRIYRELFRHSFQRQFPNGITTNVICARLQEGGKDDCLRGSGGPLMLRYKNRWFAVGVVSFGYICRRPEIPSGYTRVSNYLDWIYQNIRQ